MEYLLFLTLELSQPLYKQQAYEKEYVELKKQVSRNKPSLTSIELRSITTSILNVSKKHKIPANIYAAILMQESSYNTSAKNCRDGICHDFGMSQINSLSIQNFNLSKPKLMKNLHYSIEAGAIILADFKKRYEKREKNWWTRYNSSKIDKRRKYQQLVARYL